MDQKKMNTKLFFAVLLLPFLAGAQNLVMNGDFKMGTMGYAQRRALRFDTNPKQHYVPIETVKLPDGDYALKITSPYTETTTISSRQFALKNKTKYTLRVKMRASVPCNARILIYSMFNDWHHTLKSRFKIGTEWQEIVYHFNTGSKNVNGYFYHLDFVIPKFKGEFFIRDLEVFESSSNAENGIQFAADVNEPVLETTEKKLEWSVPVYAWNGSEKPFKGNVTVTAQEQFFKEKSHNAEVPVELAPGECKVFPVKFTTDYGCYVITEKCPEASRCVPAYQGVIGKYTAKKLDFDKDFSIGINGGLWITKTTVTTEISTIVYNAGPEKILEFLAKAGIRMLREHGGGIESTSWDQMEEEEGKWDFRHLDYTLDLYKKYNIEPVACVGRNHCMTRHSTALKKTWRPLGFPQWVFDASTPVKTVKYNWPQAVGNSDVPPLDKWRIYASKLTAHAKGRIRYYEIFNEPNGYLPAEVYFPYLKAFYEEAKKSDPDCRIAGLCVTSDFGVTGDQFTTDMMKSGAGKYMDIASFHPYSGRTLNSIKPADDYIANFRKCLGPEYEKTMPVWNSELYFLYDDDPNILHSDHEVNPARATARMMLDLGEGLKQAQSINIQQLIQRQLFPEGWYNSSSLRQILPNSTYVAYNAMARFLEAAKPVAKFKLDSGVVAYIYCKDGKLLAGLWNYKHKKGVTADLSMFDLYDLHGNSVPAAKNMEVTDIPLYLKQGKLSDKAFIDAVKNLKLEQGIPIEPQYHTRLIEFEGKKILYVTLVNMSGKVQKVIAGFSGNGLTAVKSIEAEIPAGETRVIAIPVREAKSRTNDAELQLYINDMRHRFKLKLHEGQMFQPGAPVKLEKNDFNCIWNIAKKGKDVVLNFKVIDKTDSGKPAGREVWEQDCIEIFFDNAPLEIIGMNGNHYTPATFRLFVLPRLDAGKQLVSWLDPKSPFKATDFKYTVKVSPDGYEAEITIPAEKVSDIIGLDIKASDALPGKKAHRTVAWSKAKRGHIYRSAFNLIKFSQKKAEKTNSSTAELNWNGGSPWKKTENGEFTIDYQNKGCPRLTSKQTAKAGKFYKVTFECKRDGDSIPYLYLRMNDGVGKDFGQKACTFNTWATQCAYFPVSKDGTSTVIWGINPKAKGKLTVRNGKFEEVAPEMMKQNLVLNGNFEDETVKGTAFWRDRNWKISSFPGKVVFENDFMNGEKCLELPFGSGITSVRFPMEKGKTYEISFWAKAAKNAVISSSFSLWSIRKHTGKHFWRNRKFKLGTEWKQYKFEITVPTDEATYPDLKDGTGEISISVSGDDGKYYLDDISYCEKE